MLRRTLVAVAIATAFAGPAHASWRSKRGGGAAAAKSNRKPIGGVVDRLLHRAPSPSHTTGAPTLTAPPPIHGPQPHAPRNGFLVTATMLTMGAAAYVGPVIGAVVGVDAMPIVPELLHGAFAIGSGLLAASPFALLSELGIAEANQRAARLERELDRDR